VKGKSVKLKENERKAVAMLRLMDGLQRKELTDKMEAQVIANRVSMRIGGIRKLRIPVDLKIEDAFGEAPHVKPRKRKPRP
jgi:hypothetical protein